MRELTPNETDRVIDELENSMDVNIIIGMGHYTYNNLEDAINKIIKTFISDFIYFPSYE